LLGHVKVDLEIQGKALRIRMFDNSLAQQYRAVRGSGQAAPIRFTFFWLAVDRWEGRDFVINVEGTP
jgi:hypothetical protein